MNILKTLLTASLVTVLSFSIVPVSAGSPLDSKTFVEPLDGATVAEIQLEIGLAEVHLAAGDPAELIRVESRYDARNIEPVMKVEREGDRVYVLVESKEVKKLRGRGDSDDSYRITISPACVVMLKGELGLGDNSFDFTGLQISRLELEVGLAKTSVELQEANPVRAEEIDIESGLGRFKGTNLGYLRFDRFEFSGGLGSAEIDLSGFEGKGEMVIDVGLGNLELFLPENVGVRLHHEKNFLSNVNFDRFEKIEEGLYQSEGFDTKEHRVDIELNVGLGNASIKWKK